MDYELTGLVVKGELAEVLEKEENEETSFKVEERGLAKQKDTDHATGEIVVFPGRVDDGAVLVQPD